MLSAPTLAGRITCVLKVSRERQWARSLTAPFVAGVAAGEFGADFRILLAPK